MKLRYTALAAIAVLLGAAQQQWGATLYGAGRHVDGINLVNRQLTVLPIGSQLVPVRVMAGGYYAGGYTTVSSGSDPWRDSDAHSTRVNTALVGEGSMHDNNKMSVMWRGTPLSQFNAPNQTANMQTKFWAVGNFNNFSNPYDLLNDKFFTNGEAPSVEASLLPVLMKYNVDALEQRKLKLSTASRNFGNMLCGAKISSTFVVNTVDPHPVYATRVTIAKGGKAMGPLTVGETLVNAPGSKGIALTGRLSNYNATLSKSVTLSVTSAEAASVGDTKPYAGLNVSYKANVGIAKIAPTATFTGAMKLSAQVAAGEQLASYLGATFESSDPTQTWSLASKVAAPGTLASNATLASNVSKVQYYTSGPNKGKAMPNELGSALYGAVGSEAKIFASTPSSTGGGVTMEWRKRAPNERHDGNTVPTPNLPIPSGEAARWLTSDVVRIGGTALAAGDVTYALQMGFDNRIDLSFDGQTEGTVEKEFNSLYIAKLNGSNQWERAAVGTGHWMSLEDFLAANHGTTLDALEGNWGVDPDSATDPQGRGKSWAIIKNSGGVFAVVPEPATVIMMISASIGAMVYGWRRLVRSQVRTGVWKA
jgi:hypothetical protein